MSIGCSYNPIKGLSHRVSKKIFVPLSKEELSQTLAEINHTSHVVIEKGKRVCRLVVSDRSMEKSLLEEMFEAFGVEDSAAFLSVNTDLLISERWIDSEYFHKESTIVSSLMDTYELYKTKYPLKSGQFTFFVKDGDKETSLFNDIRREITSATMVHRLGDMVSY